VNPGVEGVIESHALAFRMQVELPRLLAPDGRARKSVARGPTGRVQ